MSVAGLTPQVKVPMPLPCVLTPGFPSSVLPDGPAVQDGGGSAAFCPLHQAQRRQAGTELLQGEGDGAAALHGHPRDGEHPASGLLAPHPV